MRFEFWHMCCMERFILLNDSDAESQFSLYIIMGALLVITFVIIFLYLYVFVII